VEDPRGGPAIVGRVVQHAVDEPVAAHQRRGEAVAVEGQGQVAGQARLIQVQGAPRKLGALTGIGQVVVEECLDSPVRRAQPVGQPAAELTLAGEDRTHEPGPLGVLKPFGQRQPELVKTEIDGSVLDVGHT
jgi:hypothetical protein